MSQNQIILSPSPTGWLATFSGPAAQRVVELFGTFTLPTAFTVEASAETVRAQIQAVNPGVDVVVMTGVQQ